MRILFINPNTRSLGTLLTVYPPMGLLYMSSTLTSAGHEVRVIDADIDDIGEADLRKAVLDYGPDMVGITMNALQARSAFKTAAAIKGDNPFMKIVAGGPHPSALRGRVLSRCSSLDLAVMGEGEASMLDLASSLENGRDLHQVPGICFRDGLETISNKPRAPIEDLDSIPMPALEMAGNIRRYPGAYPVGARPSIHIMASRGCPFQCTFCSNPVWERKLRRRSVKSILDEVEHLVSKFRVREVFFQDDTFNIDRSWFESICNGLIERGLSNKAIFKAPFRANERLLDLDMLRLAKEAGFWMIFYGVESGNQAVLDSVKKNLRLEELERAFALTRKAGIRTYASFMVGNLGENRSTVQDTIRFAKKIDPDYCGFAVATPYPGSEFHARAVEMGLLDPEFEDYTLGRYVLRSESFSPGEVEALAQEAYKAVEESKNSLIRRLKGALAQNSESLPHESMVNDYFPAYQVPDEEILGSEVVMGESDIDVLGPGWYGLECWPPKVRWMGKQASAWLMNDGKSNVHISAHTVPVGLRLKVMADKREIGSVLVEPSKWSDISLPMGTADGHGALRLDLEVSRTWIPEKEVTGSGDRRELGVAVQRIWLDDI